MDPNETLVGLLKALEARDAEAALDCVETLAACVEREHEFPRVWRGLRSPYDPETVTFTALVRR